MGGPLPSQGRLASAAGFAGAFILYTVLALGLQWKAGAFDSEFGGHPDEPAHVVTGLMVRDFLAGGDWLHPMRFARTYYEHYPKVAIGHWPPVFYAVQSAWTLTFSASRPSLLVLMALLTVALAMSCRGALRDEVGPWLATAAGALLILSPMVQRANAMVMVDILVALIGLWAALAFGRYLDRGRWRDATAFGLLASLAVLTKGNGLALALLPPLAVLVSGRFRLLARASFWWPAAIVGVLCGPWCWMTHDMVVNGWTSSSPSLAFTGTAIRRQGEMLVASQGIVLLLLAAVGLVARLRRPVGGLWAASAGLLLGTWLFVIVVPASVEDRFLLPTAAPLLIFAAAGIAEVAARIPARGISPAWRTAAVALLAAAAFAGEAFTLPVKTCRGYGDAAAGLMARPEFRDSVVMISSDAIGEGAFISEFALREARPGHTIARATKVMSKSDWAGHSYRLLARTPEEIAARLEGDRIEVVAVDSTLAREPWLEHHFRLLEAIAARPECWEELGSYHVTRGTAAPGAITLYRYRGGSGHPRGPSSASRPGGSLAL